MPKRTNEFQQLILAINHHFAPASAQVTESAMLYDPLTEQNREIDILIEDEVSGYKVKVGVECTAAKRSLTVGKFDELVQKHKQCGINKSVIVSKSGFANTTIKKAKKVGVELISYEAALEKDWPSEFRLLASIKPFHVSCELISDLPMTLAEGNTLDGFQDGNDPLVIEHGLTLTDFLLQLLREETNDLMLPPYLNTEKAASEGVAFSKTWRFSRPITLKSESGRKARILNMQPTYLYYRRPLTGDLKAGIYNGKTVASSILKQKGLFRESRFTISQEHASELTDKQGVAVSLSLSV